jgi:TolB-like protein
MNHDIFGRPGGVSLTQDSSSLKGIIMKERWVVLLLVFTLLAPPFSISQPQVSIKEYQVAILPFLIHSQENIDYLREGIYDILFSRIGAEGRIAMIDRTAVERALYEERPMRLDEETAKKIGMRVGADFIVFGSLTKIGNYISLDARMISVTEDKPPLTAFTQHQGLDDVMVKIGDFGTEIAMKITGRRPTAGRAPAPGSGPSRSAIVMSREGLLDQGVTKSQIFPFEVKGVDVGDVDGDKKNELVVMDSNSLYIFRFNGEKLTLFQKLEMEPGNNFLTLDVANVNGRGPAEIIVTNLVDDNLRSFILEFEEGRFKKIHEKTGWFFRVLEHPKEGPVLMGQAMDPYGLITGPIYRLVWKKTTFEQGPKLPFPPDTKLFGLALIDTKTPGAPDPLIVDEFGRLRVLGPKGNYTWSSFDSFGGTDNYYETKKYKVDSYRGLDSPPYRVYIPGRILVRDLDGDGFNELIMNRNISAFGTAMFEKAKTFNKSEVVNMIWDQNNFLKIWQTREMDGYIADYQIRDVDNDGRDELVVALVNRSDAFERKRTSTLYFYELP